MGQKATFSKLRALNNWKKHNPAINPRKPAAATASTVNMMELRRAVERDQGLQPRQKESLLSSLQDPGFLNTLQGGALGASLSYLISKFLKLKPQTQILLSLAGFGIGKMIHDHRNNPSNFSRYNEKLRIYEIQH